MVGTYFLQELGKLRDDLEIIGDVRGKGLMIGVELVKDKVRILINMLNNRNKLPQLDGNGRKISRKL